MLTEGQIAMARAAVERALPDEATIYRRSVTNVGGEPVETWSVLAEADCRISPVGGGEEGEMGSRVSEETTHVVTFAAGTDIEEADRIAIAGVAHDVTQVRKRGVWEISRRVEVTESVDGIPEVASGERVLMAASVRAALYERLNSHEPLLAKATGGIHHQVAPQGTPYPMVIFFRQGGAPRWTFAGPPVEWELYTVKAVAKESAQAEEIFALFDTRLNDAELEVEGRDSLWLRRESDLSYPEIVGDDIYRHWGALYRVVTG